MYFHKLFSKYFIKHNQIHKYLTRNAEDYSIHKAKKKKKKKKNVLRSIHSNNWTNFIEFIRYQNETLQKY